MAKRVCCGCAPTPHANDEKRLDGLCPSTTTYRSSLCPPLHSPAITVPLHMFEPNQ
jgi:hypothetical protein